MPNKIAIVGAGIIGMTNALLLLENKFEVTVFTKDNPLETNSDAAVANWFLPDDSKPILQKHCLDSFSKFEKLTRVEESGVQIISDIFYFRSKEAFENSIWSKDFLKKLVNPTDPPYSKPEVEGFPFSRLMNIPLINPTIYRPYLLKKFESLGGQLKIKKVNFLSELTDSYDMIVNSAGWEAKHLTNDPYVYPVRGQTETMKITQELENKYSLNIEDLNAYVVFRSLSNDCVVGTTYQVGDSDKKVRLVDKQEIIKKVSAFFPEVRGIETVSKAGVRCGRSDVRMETEEIINNMRKKILIVHCYGHGGSGFSASWGSAYKVLECCESYNMNNNFRLNS
ncbi:MAG: FAD-dependent oxidoreductase [Candidatus Rickettsiella isopodorum]